MSDVDRLSTAIGGSPTAARLQSYQSSHHLAATGLPDPPTLVAAGVYPAPPIQGGSSFFRALSATESQIPQWAWLVGAAGAGAVAYLAWRGANPKGRR